jgi:hypothetical protein
MSTLGLFDMERIEVLRGSKVKFSPQKPIDEYDSRFDIDARATYAFGENERHEVSLFGRNLTGEKYCVEIQDLRGVSGSFYCVPNEGEAQYGLPRCSRTRSLVSGDIWSTSGLQLRATSFMSHRVRVIRWLRTTAASRCACSSSCRGR